MIPKAPSTTPANTLRETMMSSDSINHPPHYTYGGIEAWKLGYHLGNAPKYIVRHNHKDKPIEDLQKAVGYITIDGEGERDAD